MSKVRTLRFVWGGWYTLIAGVSFWLMLLLVVVSAPGMDGFDKFWLPFIALMLWLQEPPLRDATPAEKELSRGR